VIIVFSFYYYLSNVIKRYNWKNQPFRALICFVGVFYCLANLRDNLGDNLGDNLEANLGDKTKKLSLEYVHTSFWGSMDAYWVAFYEFPEKFLGVRYKIEDSKRLALWSKIAKSSSWFWTYENYCFVSDRPKEIHFNENVRLHNVKGPSVSWIDGYEMYSINGREMPRWIFDKFSAGTLTKEDFIKEENEDIKAGIYELIESKGEGSMLSFLGANEVDKKTFVHPNGDLEEMILYKTTEKFSEEVDLNGVSPSPLAWIRMSCPSTGQNYLIPSDGSFVTCEEAAKFARPEFVPKDLPYAWEQRN